MRLAGKVAVVTGGGSGIGRGIVLAMAREGADIAIPDIQVLNAEKVAEEVKALGRKAIAMKTDVTSSADVRAMVDRTREFTRQDRHPGEQRGDGRAARHAVHQQHRGRLGPRLRGQHQVGVPDLQGRRAVLHRAQGRPHRQHRLHRRAAQRADHARLQRGQAGRDHVHPRGGQGAGAARDHRQRDLPGRALHRVLAEAGPAHRRHEPGVQGHDGAAGLRQARRATSSR